MNQTLKILHLEDHQDDAELVARVLQKAGMNCELTHAENKDEFIRLLGETHPDIILSDHSLPSFDSHEALKITREKGLDVPFILVTATVSEEYAVSIIKEGASDYILKDRLQRLPNAILSAYGKYSLEQEGKIAAELVRKSEKKYKLLFEANPMPMWILSTVALDVIAVNEAAIKHYGYAREEFLRLNAKDLRPAEDIEKYLQYVQLNSPNINHSGIWRHKKKDGSIIMVDVIAHDLMYEDKPCRLILANDVTEKLKAEAEVTEQRIQQQKLITEVSIKAQERERNEIGKELHDNINQILAASKLYMELAVKKNGSGQELLKKSEENITLAISEIRKLSHTLVTPSLGDITLIQAIDRLFSDIELGTTLKLKLDTNNFDDQDIDKDISLMLYRVVQEQLNNILKHADANKVTVSVMKLNDEIIMVIEDDGVGFDSNKVQSGIGLRNIKNRLEYYEGSMHITSTKGNGCRLEVKAPMHRA